MMNTFSCVYQPYVCLLLLLFFFFFAFHTVHGVLKAKILKCFTIPFFSGPLFIRTLHHDLSVLGGPAQPGS